MKHLALALVLAALLPATGCFWGGECSRSVQVSWPRFLFADGTTSPSCGAAGVSSVDVWVDGNYAGTFACGDGAADVAIGRGSNTVTVEARDSGGVIRYRDELSVDGSSCGFQGTVPTEPAEGRLDVAYHFAPQDVCYQASTSYLWVYVVDDIANEVAADSSAAPTAANTCGLDFPLSLRLAAGDYSLRATREMIASGPTFTQVAGDCATHTFHVDRAGTTTVTPVLSTFNLSCP